MKRILITTGNGMFGKALIPELLSREALVRIMVRDVSKCSISHERAEIVTGDLDRPETLKPVLEGVDGIFLSSPMDKRIGEREGSMIRLAKEAGVKQIAKIGGAVKHEGDELSRTHGVALEILFNSGIPWVLVSPSSVIETSMQAFAESIRYLHAIYGCSGHGKVGLVALRDIAKVSALVLTTNGHDGKNYELTGPESIDLFEVAERFTRVLGQKILYLDLTEEQFTKLLIKYDKTLTPERIEIETLCHLRAWREGKADLVTGTYRKLTGENPTSLEEWINLNRETFLKGMLPSWIAALMRWVS
ncbi:MAG TPA: NAD(P)H-binding protein [Bacteroidales bacterium]|nr:NAD(P)H-binding protein [Bacteroidales bacterium]